MKAVRFQKSMMRLGNIFILLCLLMVKMNQVQIARATAGATTLISVASNGTLGDNHSRSASTSTATLGSCILPPAGLVSWWPGDGNADDISGSSNGTLVGGATFTSGEVGQAFSFDGIDDIVLAPATGLPTGTAPRTVAFWSKISPLDNTTTGFAYGTEATGKGFYVFPSHFENSGMLAFSGHSGYYDVFASTDLRDGLYHHVAVTYDGTLVTIYADGLSVASGSLNLDTGISGGASIGGRAYMGEFLTGDVDEVALWNRVLSASEIQAMFSAGSAGMCKNPAATLKNLVIVHGVQILSPTGRDCNEYITPYNGSHSTLGSLPKWFHEAGYQVWIAHYTTSLGFTAPLEANAKCLRDQLKSVAAQNPQPITIVAHSMGGVVSRAAIRYLDLMTQKRVSALYTLGSPHAGVNYQDVIAKRFPKTLAICVFQLGECELSEASMLAFNGLNPNLPGVTYTFIGGDATPGGGILEELIRSTAGPNDGAVGQYSSIGWVYDTTLFLPPWWVDKSIPLQYWTHEAHAKGLGGKSNDNNYSSESPDNAPDNHSDAFECIKALMNGFAPEPRYCEPLGLSAMNFQGQSESITSGSTVPVYSADTELKTGHLDAGQSVSIPLQIDTDTASLFYLTWNGDTPTFTLTRPDIQVIDPAYLVNNPAMGTYETALGGPEIPPYAAYEFPVTQPGLWQLNISATGAVDYQGFAALESSRTLVAQSDKDNYQIGDTATITANLDSNGSGLSGATITATLTRPDSVVDVVTLIDQGNGTYTNTYTIPNAPGYLTMEVTTSGSDNGTAFTREKNLLVTIAPNDLQLTGNYGDQTRDDNSDGFYDFLDFTAEVNLATLGEYAVSAELYAGDQLITQSGDFFNLSAGTQTITLSFDGAAIQASGRDGPYTIKSLNLTPIDIGIVAASVENAWTTSAYSYTQFADKTSPIVNSLTRADPNPTSAASVGFNVTLAESVTGVTADDFALYTTGVTGAAITGVSGSDSAYTVTVNTGSGNGTIRLDVVDDDSIKDESNNPLGGVGIGNGSFTTGEVYTITNGADTTGVFRPSNGALYLKNSNTTGFADIEINYGVGGDFPVVGDWDGNGTVTIGIYRNGSFYLRDENTIGFADVVFPFGLPGDQPIAGDWDGDGIDTIGVYRRGVFFLRNSNSTGAPDMIFALGIPGDVGIAGDWDGDGMDTTGVFRPTNGALYLKNTNVTGYADIQINYGLPGDKPVTGDWNDDGIDTIGVYRNGQFMLRNSNTIGFAEVVFGLGIPGDMPIAGNWDGQP